MENLVERDAKVVWHPFTQMKLSPFSLPIRKAEGCMLYGEKDKVYIDAVSSWWVNVHGHGHPYIAKAIYDQYLKIEHSIFAGFTHEPAVKLSEKLLSVAPENMARVFFSDNGSTAVEVGIKMCLQYWFNHSNPKLCLIGLEDAYHGDTFGAMSVSGRGPFNAPFESLLFDVEFIPAPVPGDEEKSKAALNAILSRRNDVAAFIFEPLVMGAGGMKMYSPEILDELMDICKENEVLCIADEVMTGIGRTGKMFATQHLRNQPDVMTVSKGITGGSMPLGLTLASEAIYEAFLSDDKMKAFFHGHSYTGNPLACAASIASLELFEIENTFDKIEKINAKHQDFAKKLQSYSCVENIRIQGTIVAFDLRSEENTSYFNSVRDQAYNYFIDQGVLLRPLGNVIYILPPYSIDEPILDQVYSTIFSFLDKV